MNHGTPTTLLLMGMMTPEAINNYDVVVGSRGVFGLEQAAYFNGQIRSLPLQTSYPIRTSRAFGISQETIPVTANADNLRACQDQYLATSGQVGDTTKVDADVYCDDYCMTSFLNPPSTLQLCSTTPEELAACQASQCFADDECTWAVGACAP